LFIHEYTQLDQDVQANILTEKGICFDSYRDKDKTVSVYFLFDFFVEVTNSSDKSEITPYRKGYRYSAQS
jgi:hypothetical protein